MKFCTIKYQKGRIALAAIFAVFFSYTNQTAAQPAGQFVYIQRLSDAIEGGTNGLFKIGLHYPVPLTADVVVNYSFLASGQAQSVVDFNLIPAFTGSVTIPAGATETLINVDASNDGIIEGPENMGIQLISATSGGSPLPIDPSNGAAQVNIVDANAVSSAPVQIFIGSNASEPVNSGSFTVKLAGVAVAPWPIYVGYRLSGTASSGLDFQQLGDIIIPPNTNSVTFPFNVVDDHIIEGPENVLITLLSGSTTDGGGNAYIFPPDPVNEDISISLGDDDYIAANTLMYLSKVADGAEPATPAIIRMGLPSDYVSAGNATANIQFEGSATGNGGDYSPATAVLPAYHNFADVYLTVVDDTLTEETETVLCTLISAIGSNSVVYTADPAQNIVTVDIADDDGNLPLRLISFAGTAQDDGTTALKWITAEEENTSYFEIQRSHDGHSFVPVGLVPASGSGNHNYTFTDHSPDVHNLYRLRMVDLDGSFAYSRIISISTVSKNPVTVFPNPAHSQLTVDFGEHEIFPIKVNVVDSGGKFCKQVQVNGNRASFSLNGLVPGMYILSFDTGEAVKFVVR